MTFMKCRHATKSWESGHRQRCVILSYNRDDSLIDSFGKGRIYLDHGNFSNVLYVPGLSSNLLSVYQMTCIGTPKKVILSPDEVDIT